MGVFRPPPSCRRKGENEIDPAIQCNVYYYIGFLRQDPEGYVRGRVDPAVREVRTHLGPQAHDGPHVRT